MNTAMKMEVSEEDCSLRFCTWLVWVRARVFIATILRSKLMFCVGLFVFCIGEERKTPSDSNSPSSSSLSALSDSANSKEDAEISPKPRGSNNLLVISVVPGSQTLLNTEEKSEKGKNVGDRSAKSLPLHAEGCVV